MATWQLYLHFIPRNYSMLDSSPGWEPLIPQKLAYAVQEDLCHYLGSPWFMLDDWLVFGPENGNRVDVLFELYGDTNLSVRVDTRNDSPQFIVLATYLARLHGCVFFDPEGRELVEPELHHVRAVITRKEIRSLGLH